MRGFNTMDLALEARGGIEPPIKVLQTFALPLGYRAVGKLRDCNFSVPRPLKTDTFLGTDALLPAASPSMQKTDLKAPSLRRQASTGVRSLARVPCPSHHP